MSSTYVFSAILLFLETGESLLIDLVNQLCAAVFDDMAVHKHMGPVNMEGFQNSGGVGDDQKRPVLILLVLLDPGGNGADRIDIEAGVGLVKDGQRRLQHQHLKELCYGFATDL